MRIDYDLSAFNQLRDETVQLLGRGMRDAVYEGVIVGADHAKHEHPHKTRTGDLTGPKLYGHLVRSDTFGTVGEIVNASPYARLVEYGTKPHVIYPKEGHGFIGPLRGGQTRRGLKDIGTHRAALRFVVGGRTVFRAFVRHPGGRPFPFMEPAAKVAARVAIERIENTVFESVAALWD